VEVVAGRGWRVADPLAERSRVYLPARRSSVKAPEVVLEMVGARTEVEKHARDLLSSLLPGSSHDGVVVVGDGAGAWILCARGYQHDGRKVWAGVLILIFSAEKEMGNEASCPRSHGIQRRVADAR
jgi:hypothetical protein